jgi:hypothetical protein
MMRMLTSRIGARMPTCAYVGKSPIAKVAMPISSSAPTSTGFRPNRSARYPPTDPPIGRMRKPTPSVAKESSVPTVGSDSGKKASPK